MLSERLVIMNQGQEQFQSYILERIQEGRKDDAKVLLTECFKKQDAGTFTRQDVTQIIPKLIPLLHPDKVEEVHEVIKNFAHHL